MPHWLDTGIEYLKGVGPQRAEALKKEFESVKGQKNAKGNVNTAAMRRIAADIIEEEKKLKSGN